MNKILKTTKFVIDNSSHVKIDKDKINEFCLNFKRPTIHNWLDNLPSFSKLNYEEKLNFILIINSMNFCYWGIPKWNIEYNGKEYDGGFAMLFSLERALKNNIPILNPLYLKDLSEEDFKNITSGNITIPLIKERVDILNQIGSCLEKKKLSDLLKDLDKDIFELIELIVSNFPSFEDSSNYKKEKIYFYKRAQLLIFDLNYYFREDYKNTKEINEMTACADYKLPQILRKLGILAYSEELRKKVDKGIEILKDSEEEVEIRASTIWAIEYIKNKLKENNPEISSIEIDSYLWNQGQIKSPNDKPYHLTKTIAY